MKARGRLLWILVGSLTALWVALVAVTAVWIVGQGMLTVQVDEAGPGGEDVSIRIPGALALAVTYLISNDLLHERLDAGRRWAPVGRICWDALSQAPDCVLVRVNSPNERVRIAKTGRHLILDAYDHGDRVHISIPIRFVGSVLRRLERAA